MREPFSVGEISGSSVLLSLVVVYTLVQTFPLLWEVIAYVKGNI